MSTANGAAPMSAAARASAEHSATIRSTHFASSARNRTSMPAAVFGKDDVPAQHDDSLDSHRSAELRFPAP
ncbi:MAG: hypothetical protein D6741_11300 [Planctomycetota bacterium]|nr:MAG: hypothetical protein D6741_11300 [Planctomycetota bacterium]